MTIMFFLFLGAMLGLQKAAGYEHGKKTSVMIICHLKYGQIWRTKVQVQTVREAFFKFWKVLCIICGSNNIVKCNECVFW